MHETRRENSWKTKTNKLEVDPRCCDRISLRAKVILEFRLARLRIRHILPLLLRFLLLRSAREQYVNYCVHLHTLSNYNVLLTQQD